MPGSNAVETRVNDPVHYRAPLPYAGRYYPYGFPVEILSDAREVLAAAERSYGAFTPRFDRPALRVHVFVTAGSPVPPPAPALRGQRHLLMWVSDHENFAVIDRAARFGYSCVTRATLDDQVFFRWHFLDSLVYTLLEFNYLTFLHAACVAWNGAGVLLASESGMGKSTVSYACARNGWTYVSDDACAILWDSGRTVIGEPHRFRFREDAPDLFPELRGRIAGRQLESKPTIEVASADLPIRTAAECRVAHIAFLEREPGIRAGIRRIAKEEALERFEQDTAAFDPEMDARRRRDFEKIAESPAYHLRYSSFDDAVSLLEHIVRGGSEV